jgi:hypothetical protein
MVKSKSNVLRAGSGVVATSAISVSAVPKTNAITIAYSGNSTSQIGGIVGGIVALLIIVLISTILEIRRLNKPTKFFLARITHHDILVKNLV